MLELGDCHMEGIVAAGCINRYTVRIACLLLRDMIVQLVSPPRSLQVAVTRLSCVPSSLQ